MVKSCRNREPELRPNDTRGLSDGSYSGRGQLLESPLAFQISPECKGTEFIVDSTVSSDPQDIRNHFLQVRKAPHWRLRVDYGPRLIAQPFSLDLTGGSKDFSRLGGGGESTAKDMMTFACEMSKGTGVLNYW
jgi:hypothetical protein